jgi:thermostable 8-oxoguanine DNA glycosylase
MNQVNRKTPDELISKTKKQPLSARVKVETYEALEKIADEVGTSLSDLSAGILDDYVQWYLEQGNKVGKRHGKK